MSTSPSPTETDTGPALDLFEVDEAALARVLGQAMARGADFADLYFQHKRTNVLTHEDGIVSQARGRVERGVGIRTVVGDQTGYAYSEDLDEASMMRAAAVSASIASSGASAPPVAFTGRAQPDVYPSPRDTADVDRKVQLVRRTDAMARSMEPSIEKVSVNWMDEEDRVLIATSDGVLATDLRPMGFLFCVITAVKDGEVQTNYGYESWRRGIDWYENEPRLAALCRDAVDRTMILYEARRPPAGEMPVVLAAGDSAILLHEAIGHGMEADFNRKGRSIYSTLMGEKVGPECATIVDTALHPFARGSLNVDDEGTPGERTVLVEDGVLRSYLQDRISAKHYGVPSTGSGRRESFRFAPVPRMRCTYMENGPHTRDEIVASVDRGIIAQTFTNGQVNIGAGDFTFYLKNGWMVENGKITYPIKDVNIVGNGPEALRDITMVADDLEIPPGGGMCGKDGQGVPVSHGMPTTLVSRLTVGGDDA